MSIASDEPTIATVDDLRTVLFENSERIRIGTEPGDHLSEETANVFIVRSEVRFYARVRKYYSVPFTEPVAEEGEDLPNGAAEEWNLLKSVIVNLTLADIYTLLAGGTGSTDDIIKALKADAKEIIDQICSENAGDRLFLITQSWVDESYRSSSQPCSATIEVFGAKPFPYDLSFSGYGYDNYIALDYVNIIENSERLMDADMEETYIKGTDYDINYKDGYIWALDGGDITLDTTVYLSGEYIKPPIFYRGMSELYGDKKGLRESGYN